MPTVHRQPSSSEVALPAPSGEADVHVVLTPPDDRELHRTVWRLAWPSVTMMLLQTFNSLLDVFFVGHLPNGTQAMAATGAGGGVIFLMISLAMGVTVGTSALVARFTGARDLPNAIRATGQSLTLAALLAFCCGIPAYFGRALLVGAMLDSGKSPQTALLCSQFLGIALLATVPLFVMNVLQAAFRGIGDTRTPMRITAVTVAIHVAINSVLITGRLGFPALGVRGAGVALASSITAGMILFSLQLIRRTNLQRAFSLEELRPRTEWMARILKIGIPASIQGLTRTVSMMLFTGMLARTLEGAAGVAALQIGIRSEAVAFMPGFGYSVAAAALVGQSLGAKDPDRAERFGWAATWQAIGVMSGMALLFLVFAHPISRLFSNDPTVQELGAAYLRINAVCEPFLALGMVLTGALQGAGETIRPTFVTLFTMVLVRLPIAWMLMFSFRLQTRGAWYSMTVTTIVGGLMTTALFRSGAWKRIKV